MEVYFKNLTSEEISTEKLVEELTTLVEDAEQLVRATGSTIGEASRQELITALQRLKARAEQVRPRAMARARSTQRPIRRQRYRSRALLKKVLLGNNGIVHRHLALDSLADGFDLSPDAMHARFREHAPKLASEAARNAMAKTALRPNQIDALLISTCTGYLCPGL